MKDRIIIAGMREATRLTRAGQLHEAAAIIQRTLQSVQGLKPAAEPRSTAPETSARGSHRHLLPGMAGMDNSEPSPGGPKAGQGRTACSDPVFGAGLPGKLQEKLRGYRGPRP